MSKAEQKRELKELLKSIEKHEVVTVSKLAEEIGKAMHPYDDKVKKIFELAFSNEWGFRVISKTLIDKNLISKDDLKKAEAELKKSFKEEAEKQTKEKQIPSTKASKLKSLFNLRRFLRKK